MGVARRVFLVSVVRSSLVAFGLNCNEAADQSAITLGSRQELGSHKLVVKDALCSCIVDAVHGGSDHEMWRVEIAA